MNPDEIIPDIKGVKCWVCRFELPDLVVHGYGRLDDRDEPSTQYLVKCDKCKTWHRYDKVKGEWMGDERATKLGKTHIPLSLRKNIS